MASHSLCCQLSWLVSACVLNSWIEQRHGRAREREREREERERWGAFVKTTHAQTRDVLHLNQELCAQMPRLAREANAGSD